MTDVDQLTEAARELWSRGNYVPMVDLGRLRTESEGLDVA